MKTMIKITAGLLLVLALFPRWGFTERRSGQLFTVIAQPINLTKSFDIGNYERFSLQVNYADGTPASHTFTDGAKSSGTIVVTGRTGFSGSESVTINGISVTEGVDWTNASTASGTAKAISDAIVADTSLSTIVVSTWGNNAFIVLTGTNTGAVTPFFLMTSTPGLSVVTPFMINGSTPDVSVGGDTFSESSHGLIDGMAVFFTTAAAATAPSPLTSRTTYYAIVTNDDVYQLATSTMNAVAGTDIDITALAYGGATFTVAPIALTGTPSFRFQGSNDDSNWFTIASTIAAGVAIGSVTYSSDASTMWNFGEYPHRYLRLNYLAPTWSGLTMTGTVFGTWDD